MSVEQLNNTTIPVTTGAVASSCGQVRSDAEGLLWSNRWLYGTHAQRWGSTIRLNIAGGGVLTVVMIDAASGANGEIVGELAPATREGAIDFMRTAAHEVSHYHRDWPGEDYATPGQLTARDAEQCIQPKPPEEVIDTNNGNGNSGGGGGDSGNGNGTDDGNNGNTTTMMAPETTTTKPK